MSDPAAADDRADMLRLAEGRDAALDALMARHGGRLHAYLLRLLQNESDAEDLAQECFVRVYQHRARFDPAQNFATWLYTIATNLVRDRYRWRSRHPETPFDPDPGPAADGTESAGPGATLPTAGPGPAESLVAAEAAGAVRSAVGGLPPELREPLVLAEFEDLSHAEIGAILGLTSKAVEVRVYRARQRLRRVLQPWLAEPPSPPA